MVVIQNKFLPVLPLNSLDKYEKFLKLNCIMPEKVGKVVRRTSSMTNSIQDIELEVLKQNISNKHRQMVTEIDEKLDKVFDDFLNEVNKLSLNRFEVEKLFEDDKNGKTRNRKNAEKSRADDRKKSKKVDSKKLPSKLPEKHYQARNSLLTDLFEIKHINTIYHIFIVIFNLLLLNVFVSDFADTGKINIGLRPIRSGFKGLHYSLFIWGLMQLTIFLLYPAFRIWAFVTTNYFLKRGTMTNLWHFIGVLSVIGFQSTFVVGFTYFIMQFDLGQASAVAVLMELVRFMMKSYAFIRTNVPRVIYQRKKVKSSDESELDYEEDKNSDDSEVKEVKLPESGSPKVNNKRVLTKFSQYTYFLFAPTLVYRDEYPRSKHIRWNFVIKCFIEVISIIFIMSFISERIMYPVYNQFGSQFYEVGVKELIASVFNAMLPGLLCFLCGFYCVLHSWMNAFAEFLRFSDRMFYRDWWNSTNFSVYYRTWNVIVHDWLYLYVYKDLYLYVFKKNRTACQFLVFLLSALFHEYILGFTFRFCYPILFVEFQGAGVLLFFATRKDLKTIGNCMMWMSLAIGMGLLLSLYHMEFYARENCTFDKENWLNYFIPISWSCNGLRYSDNWEVKIHF